jgi:hypothetical protein
VKRTHRESAEITKTEERKGMKKTKGREYTEEKLTEQSE